MRKHSTIFCFVLVLVLVILFSFSVYASQENSEAATEIVQTESVALETEQVETSQYDGYYEEYKDELPEVESNEVQLATALSIPIEDISESSLIGGVIAWLCVAVGVAVIVGVLVSKRTSNKR